ncbi:MAG: 16S rRNA (adenine(1518)-N(6)/adenine(1519)-N(6))-dimethyltransferase RsmA [Candidatus Moraniibacteriota bacterium]
MKTMNGIHPKKSLGQNFLKDQSVIERILAAAEVVPGDKIFEIGPGTGVLTEALAKRGGQVLAIELDHELVERLNKHFEESAGVSILEGSILGVNLAATLAHASYPLHGYKVVANIPYYITAPIIRTLLSLERQPQSLTLMVQKEVAERLTAKPGAMSLLSLMAQYYSDAALAFVVPKEAFDPVPKVDSAVVRLVPKRRFDAETDRQFFRLARAGFAARRKTLSNNLSSSLKIEKNEIEAAFVALGLRADIRAQSLSVLDWQRLQETLSPERLT